MDEEDKKPEPMPRTPVNETSYEIRGNRDMPNTIIKSDTTPTTPSEPTEKK